MKCIDCKLELEGRDFQDAWQRVVGWEHRRKQGGTNALALRQPQQFFICAGCMTRRKLGFRADQGSLL